MTSDVLSQIHNAMPQLSKGQKRIGEYILDHYDKAAFMTAAVLGNTVQVSESTVVRFACQLGYDGYPQMQRFLQEMVRSCLTSVQRIETAPIAIKENDFLSVILNGDIERIRQSRDTLDSKVFQGAVDALVDARRIYVIGVRSASALAGFLYFYLNYMFDQVELVTSASESEMLEKVIRVGPTDAVIGISFPRYSSATVKAMHYGSEVGAATIALTDSISSPLIPHTQYALIAKSDMVSLVDSLVAPMSVINALLAALSEKKKEDLRSTLSLLESVWEQNHVYKNIDE